MPSPKLPVRVKEALSKAGWQEYGSTSSVASYRRPLAEIVIQPSKTHKGRYAIVLDYHDKRSGIANGVDEDTLIKYLTSKEYN